MFISIRDLSTKSWYLFEKEEARKILEDANSCFQYGEELKLTVKQEIHDYKITSQDHNFVCRLWVYAYHCIHYCKRNRS